jgi:hypothetical protein
VLKTGGDIACTLSYISVNHYTTHDPCFWQGIIQLYYKFSVTNWFGVFFHQAFDYTSLLHFVTNFCRCHLVGDAWHSRLVCGSGPNEIIYKNDTDRPCYLWKTMKIRDHTWTTYLPNHSAILFLSLVSGNKESVTLTGWSHSITLS